MPAPNQDGDLQPIERLNGRGASCATLTPLIATRVRALQPGERLEVVSDDETAPDAIGSWARLTGHRVVSSTRVDDGAWSFTVERKW
jgi:TusA-related sulfurtransferase